MVYESDLESVEATLHQGEGLGVFSGVVLTVRMEGVLVFVFPMQGSFWLSSDVCRQELTDTSSGPRRHDHQVHCWTTRRSSLSFGRRRGRSSSDCRSTL